MEWRRKSLISKGMATKLFEMRCKGKEKKSADLQSNGLAWTDKDMICKTKKGNEMEQKHTNEEIIKAVTVIKEVCESTRDCADCPLFCGEAGCVIEENPSNWSFNDEKTKLY